MDGAKGDITFCTGKDTTGSKTAGVEEFNAQNNGMTAKLVEFPESADEQRNQFVTRQEASRRSATSSTPTWSGRRSSRSRSGSTT